MKLQTLAFILVALTSTFALSEAGECTQAQLESFSNLGSESAAKKACGSDAATIFAGTSSSTTTVCADDDCLSYIKKVLSDAPDCTISGISPTLAIDTVISYCKNSDSTTASSSAGSSPLLSTPDDARVLAGAGVAALSGLVVAAVAMV
ncbi:hypothetical protein Poli38472_001436 [Pythium oligandrum]|uniref:Elicitin-like protein n=1 Tax=Pythium oligandrum TaxID=41045 RepID=A0A8K1CTF9_PYTOL|nr:hypothetical protein Poli38472_001436 [Pythium oligandrum]|eukprot:TMW69280.1 hypothetical protein Poli38472_001436 [Pythium oligandrum]